MLIETRPAPGAGRGTARPAPARHRGPAAALPSGTRARFDAGVRLAALVALWSSLLLYRYTGRPLFSSEFEVLAAERGLQVLRLPGHRRAAGSWLGGGVGAADDRAALTRWVPDIADRDVYVCGPAPWADDVRRSTQHAGRRSPR